MPVYNGALHLRPAIDSVLAQTYSQFELLLIDDGSTDDTLAITRSYQDPRIRIIETGDHSGITHALNTGLRHTSGAYIARMDADDVCSAVRLERQIAFMESHRDILLCGTNMQLLNSTRRVTLPTEHEDIRAHLLFSNCISHPTVMIRGHDFSFPAAYPNAEDYALWATMVETGKFHNLPEPLYSWRIHDAQVSTVKYDIGRASGKAIHRMLLTRFGVSFSEDELSLHTSFQQHIGTSALDAWLDKLLAHNLANPYYAHAALSEVTDNIRNGRYVLL
ncbi:glycosyltransferase family 2 protein [Alicyclobacillus sp. ALC3]|uniref:glycosyltransferase family 2 protein n=1 Tax=Alicyclobacillus sp. ALC3 TaxID=2796143 RepID=UPI002378C414|nr:glycosyltransferase [Alicyclobacillus sp. ALC3]WDL96852.1 glycosyltransferase [Alicyclobacillus sp. ALC3]